MSDPLPAKYLERLRARAKRANGSVLRRAEWENDWVSSPVIVLQLCGEIDRLAAELAKAKEGAH